jgi:AGZA family xanthine/uracil permease-like MFS transporter
MVSKILKKIYGDKIHISTEIIAGITTFLTMAYIIFVNPNILSATGMDKHALMIVTCLVSGIITIITGLLTNSPFAMAPGMGLNAFFAYTLVLTDKISWQTALGIVFISGALFLLLTWLGLRQKIVEAIPRDLLNAIAVGIGIFIAFIGLQNMGLIIKNDATMVSAAHLNKTILIGLAGLLVMVALELRKVKGSLLIGIFTSTFISVLVGYTTLPAKMIEFNFDISSLWLQLNIKEAFRLAFLAPVFTLMFMDLFDSIGSILGLAKDADMIDKQGKIPMLDRLLNIDALATMFGACAGTSTTTTYIESASGIASGGRSGLTSLITGILFLVAIVFVPILAIVPAFATAPALIMVGFFMIKNIVHIDFKNMEIGFPSFLIIIMIALSYSISTGLAFGFISFSLIKIIKGKYREIKPALWIITMLSVIYFLI